MPLALFVLALSNDKPPANDAFLVSNSPKSCFSVAVKKLIHFAFDVQGYLATINWASTPSD